MRILLCGLAATASLVATVALADTVTVTSPSGVFSNPTTVNAAGPTVGYDRWFANNVRSGGSVGITAGHPDKGNGSIEFTAPANTNAKADMEYYFTPSTAMLLSDVTAFSYDVFRSSGSTASARYAPALRLYVSDGSHTGYLVYEGIYNNQPVAPVDTFSTVDVLPAKVWSTGTLPDAASNYNRTIADWVNLLPNLKVYGLSAGIGSGWDGTFDGAVDNITFGTRAGGTTTYNFELAQTNAAVPEPASWALMIGGLGLVGGTLRRRKTVATSFA